MWWIDLETSELMDAISVAFTVFIPLALVSCGALAGFLLWGAQ